MMSCRKPVPQSIHLRESITGVTHVCCMPLVFAMIYAYAHAQVINRYFWNDLTCIFEANLRRGPA